MGKKINTPKFEQHIKPLRIAFVSSRPSMRRFREDGSFIYRCENLALALQDMGHKVFMIHLTTLLFRRNFDVVVFLRPTGGRVYSYVTNRLRARGAILVGDVDDLIFDPAYAQFSPAVVNQKGEANKTRDRFASNKDALSKLDKVIVSTEGLACHFRALFSKIECAVIPNACHRSWFTTPSRMPDVSARCISYFSGTRTHDRDFGIVAPVLERLLSRHEDLTVRIVGQLSTDLNHPRVIKIPPVPFQGYAQLVGASHICIAPLQDTPFNQCKSALKALEAGGMSVPVVASSVSDYATMNVNGVLLAKTEDEWEAHLEFALDSANYKKLSEGLRERIIAYSDIDEHARTFLNFVMRPSSTVKPHSQFFVVGNAQEKNNIAHLIGPDDIVIRFNEPHPSCQLKADWVFIANGYTQTRLGKRGLNISHTLFKSDAQIFFRYHTADVISARYQHVSYMRRFKYLFSFPRWVKHFGLDRYKINVLPTQIYQECANIVGNNQPSTGFLAVYYVMKYYPGHRIYLHNFTYEGSSIHDWTGEKKIVSDWCGNHQIKVV